MSHPKPSPWAYDPRPIDHLRITATYDWVMGRYRLTATVRRNGDHVGVTETVEGLTRDDIADHVAIVLSSVAEEDLYPF